MPKRNSILQFFLIKTEPVYVSVNMQLMIGWGSLNLNIECSNGFNSRGTVRPILGTCSLTCSIFTFDLDLTVESNLSVRVFLMKTY